MHYCTQFVLIANQLWCKDTKMHHQHKMVIPCDWCLFLMSSAHNDVGDHGVFATTALLSRWYWWPVMGGDVAWYIGTCHVCQQQTTQQSFIPPVVTMPAPLFSKVYMNTMHMPSLSVHCSGPLFPNLLARVGYASKRKRSCSRKVDFT